MSRSTVVAVAVIVILGGVFGAPAWVALPLVALALTPRLV